MAGAEAAAAPISMAGQANSSPQAPVTTMAALYGVGTRLREYGSVTFAKRKPWMELLDRTSFARPASLGDATARLRKNAAYFRTNYLIVMLTSVAASFLMHPSSLIVLSILMVGWVYAMALRTGPLVVNGREISEREKMMSMSALSFVVIFFLTNVASVVFSALLCGSAVVAAHGATYNAEDLFLEDGEANQSLLSIFTGGGSATVTGVSNV